MNEKFELVIYSPAQDEIDRLIHYFVDSRNVRLFRGNGPEASSACHLDAVFVTGMQMSYWDVDPFLKNRAAVFPSPAAKTKLGLPSRFVAGWLGADGDPSSYGERYLRLLLEAVDQYNARHPDTPVQKVGSSPTPLNLTGEYARMTASIVDQLLSEHQGFCSRTREQICA